MINKPFIVDSTLEQSPLDSANESRIHYTNYLKELTSSFP